MWKATFSPEGSVHIGPEHVLPRLYTQKVVMENEQFWSLAQNKLWEKWPTERLNGHWLQNWNNQIILLTKTIQDNRIVHWGTHNAKNTLYPHLGLFSGCLKWPKQGKYTVDCLNNITRDCEYPWLSFSWLEPWSPAWDTGGARWAVEDVKAYMGSLNKAQVIPLSPIRVGWNPTFSEDTDIHLYLLYYKRSDFTYNSPETSHLAASSEHVHLSQRRLAVWLCGLIQQRPAGFEATEDLLCWGKPMFHNTSKQGQIKLH